MSSEENQNTEEIVIEENIVPIEPKRDVVENIPIVVEEIPAVADVVVDEQIIPIEEIKDRSEQIEIPKVVEPTTKTPVIETTEISQTETEKTPVTIEVEQPKPNQTQETPLQPQIKTVEKIVYQTPPRDTSNEVNGQANFIQNLLNKARAKIQERKRKKLNKILSLFETKSQITNSDIQKLLRVSRATSKRYMDILEKENKVTQVGSTGKGVFYTKKP